ncbi:MAG: hypothetical protein IT488_13545 [Gammaproteobacteria bacterium]|nr:hypothetical protein [Gammaproteobacteria bacterium]
MQMAIWRGQIENLTATDQQGESECQVGSTKVRLHPDLVSSVSEGDKVLVSGSSADGVLQAMAVHNLTKDKLTQIDPTNQILITGLFGFIGMLSLAVGWQNTMNVLFLILNTVAIIGAAGAVRSISRIVRVARAASWIRYPDLAERS